MTRAITLGWRSWRRFVNSNLSVGDAGGVVTTRENPGRGRDSPVGDAESTLEGRKFSDVEVHLELVRVRSEADRVDLVLGLPLDPGLDEVLGEDVALEQELVVGRERLEDRRE